MTASAITVEYRNSHQPSEELVEWVAEHDPRRFPDGSTQFERSYRGALANVRNANLRAQLHEAHVRAALWFINNRPVTGLVRERI